MKCRRLLGLIAVCLLFSMSLLTDDIVAKNRVIGADLIKGDIQRDEVYYMIMDLPFNQSEIDLFLNSLDPIEKWANEHRQEWNSAAKAENFNLVFPLSVWESTDVTAAEFIALSFKLYAAQEVVSGALDATRLKKHIESYEKMLSKAKSERSKVRLENSLKWFTQMLQGLNNYPIENKRLFEQNRGKLEEGLARVARFGEPSGQE